MNIKLVLMFSVLYSCVSLSSELIMDCGQIKSTYNLLKNGGQARGFISSNDIALRFEKVKQFTSGKGGASVYWVKDRGVDRVLKIFPEETLAKEFENNNELREIYFSCHLAKQKFWDNMLTFSTADTSFFPGFFGFGYSDTDQPFDGGSKKKTGQKYFLMLMEFINGKDMFSHSEATKDPQSPFRNKQQTQAILYQVVSALKNAHADLGFFHMDLHPGNIMLSSNKTVSLITSQGERLVVPMVKIIDFGLSTGRDFYKNDKIDPVKASNLSLAPSRNQSLVLLNFGRNMRSSPLAAPLFLSKAVEIANLYPAGDDLQFFNMMIYVFRNTFDSFNDYCKDYYFCQMNFQRF